jgi:hypothetical protein
MKNRGQKTVEFEASRFFVALRLFAPLPAVVVKNLFVKTPIGWNFIQPVGVSVFASHTIRPAVIPSGGNENEAETNHRANRNHRTRADIKLQRMRQWRRSIAC